MVLGLTGGSGTGKSTACRYFEQKGFIVVDSDLIAHRVCTAGHPCMAELVAAFGAEVADQRGNLDRAVMRNIVFADKEKLGMLNAITHKYIIEENINIIEQNPGKNIVLDAPLLFESGLGDECDEVLCVLCSSEKRLERIMQRDGISRENALARLKNQPEDDYYISKCNYVLYNDGTEEELLKGLEDIFGGV